MQDVFATPLLLDNILAQLDSPDLVVASFVSRDWNDLAKCKKKWDEFLVDNYWARKVSKRGYLEVLKWAKKNGCRFDDFCCSAAAKGGHMETLKWLRSGGIPWDEKVCLAASAKGNLEILKYAQENGCLWDLVDCTIAAVKSGDVKIVKYLVKKGKNLVGGGAKIYPTIFSMAAGRDDIPMMRLLRFLGCPWSENTFRVAAGSAAMKALKWLRRKGCPWGWMVFAEAAANGHIGVLEWLKRKGCPWDKRSHEWAAEFGQKDAAEWLKKNGCPTIALSCFSFVCPIDAPESNEKAGLSKMLAFSADQS